MLLALAGLVASALFAGAALYINVAEQPARLRLTAAELLKEWKPAYRNGTRMQAPLAGIGFLLGVAAWWQSSDVAFLIAGIAMFANVPWTFLVIYPTNNRLEATPETSADENTRALIIRWGRLHAVRTALGLIAAASFLVGLIGPYS
jgi:anthrone oxygenase-like protein